MFHEPPRQPSKASVDLLGYHAWSAGEGKDRLAKYFGGTTLATPNASAGIERDGDRFILAAAKKLIAQSDGVVSIKEIGCGTTAHPLFGTKAFIPSMHRSNFGAPWLSRYLVALGQEIGRGAITQVVASDIEGSERLVVITDKSKRVYFEPYSAFCEAIPDLPTAGVIPNKYHLLLQESGLNADSYGRFGILQAQVISCLDPKVEREVFGLTIQPLQDFVKPPNSEMRRYDLLFIRHVDLSDGGTSFSKISEGTLAQLKEGGIAIIDVDVSQVPDMKGSVTLLVNGRNREPMRISSPEQIP
jgi:hypothetical protein